ncbi:MAG: DUF192 domain-containing protein [Alphaproteobacteria bacterium]|nr:DUF192 domain-containing protein [Alphaproteobacteria bacterium]
MRWLLILGLIFYSHVAMAAELWVADKVQYQIKIAKTLKERQRGLMYVQTLPENAGMMFDMRQHGYKAMWMKNTYIPLDMLFLDCQFKVVDIYEKAEPLSLKHITSPHDFCYVVEINGGQVEQKDLKIGDEVMLKD